MGEATEGHYRRSSLSEALESHNAETHNVLTINTKEDESSMCPESPFTEDFHSQTFSSMKSAATDIDGFDHEFQSRKSGIVEAEQSPFTPDFPVYELCADAKQPSSQRSFASSNPSTLSTVPEDSPPPLDRLQAPVNTSALLSPEKLKLKQVKTPRKSMELDGRNPFTSESQIQLGRQDSDPDFSQRLQPERTRSDAGSVSSCVFKPPDVAFNPFEADRDSQKYDSPQGMSSMEDGFFPMDFSSQKSQEESGLEALSLESGCTQEHIAQTPSESRETLRQLMQAVEDMITDIQASHENVVTRRSAGIEKEARIQILQAQLDALKGEEADVDAQLRVIHSQLEAHLLSNLEQEEELRVTGEHLKRVREEIDGLDVALQKAEEQRRSLERQLAQQKARKLPIAEGEVGLNSVAEREDSPKSNYSSAWETSDSETETYLDVRDSIDTRRRTLSEDNEAKMSQQGAKGGSWLQEVLKNKGRKEALPAPIQGEIEEISTPKGGGLSHFQLPTVVAEVEKTSEEDEKEGMQSQKSLKI